MNDVVQIGVLIPAQRLNQSLGLALLNNSEYSNDFFYFDLEGFADFQLALVRYFHNQRPNSEFEHWNQRRC